MTDNTAGANLPEDSGELNAHLAEMTDAELSDLESKLVGDFDTVFNDGDVSSEDFDKLNALKDQITTVRDLTNERVEAKRERDAKAAELRNAVFGSAEEVTEEASEDAEATEEATESANEAKPEARELVTASSNVNEIASAVQAAVGETVKAFAADYLKSDRDLNKRLRLGAIAEYAPDAKVPVKRTEAVITASADIPGFTQGGRIESVSELAKAFHARARNMPVSRSGNPDPIMIASLQREFTFNVEKEMSMETLNDVLSAAADPEILTAAGGWCAPSEISYNFYNIVCEDGMIDLPTVGLSRGGIQYPTSPSFGDLANNPDIVWTWTEQDDIDALDSSSIIKPCVRVDCPTFIDRRKDCDGFCVTAGNLMDFAYPEAVENWLELVMAIRAHATNARIIDLILNGGGSGDDIGASVQVDHTALLGATTAALLNSIELTIWDLREKYAMCADAPIEIILPRWAYAVVRADLANRDGIDVFAVTDGMVADWMNLRGARLQLVSDWQVRDTGLPGDATPATDWPATLQYVAYPAGTFVRGNGMSLNLGVVRDSVLNETNDHTAAWAEDCYAITKPGHESRVVTVDICGSGQTGARDIVCA